jgi:hypothetical protein
MGGPKLTTTGGSTPLHGVLRGARVKLVSAPQVGLRILLVQVLSFIFHPPF